MENVMAKVPFKVSARTARLIGRENIATSKGAIIELVKNAYDADSPICIVYFDNKYSEIKSELTETEFFDIANKITDKNIINDMYSKKDSYYALKENINNEIKAKYKEILSKLNTLYIIDAGEGMTQSIIRNHWMTIGTDNKSIDVFTDKGRVKAGAKGIGRFALDKLGNKTQMFTIFDQNDVKHVDVDQNGEFTFNSGYIWDVQWSDFEGDFKTIDTVNANLEDIKNGSLFDFIRSEGLIDSFDFPFIERNFQHGTMLKISQLRDTWDTYFVNQIFEDLEILVPPKEDNTFSLYLYNSLIPDNYGEVVSSICEDFDYKLIAKADKNQNVELEIIRNEYDLDLIDPNLFNQKGLQIFPYRKKDFTKGSWKIKTTFSKLIPGFKNVDNENILNNINEFEFIFYFMKKSYSTPDAEKFYYRKFLANQRKDWLNQFGGIKLFRDNFRVRPYGENKDSAFDWLSLGSRRSSSPAGTAKSSGGWRVGTDQVAGSIKISRLTNVAFEDKSSREGLQENKTFILFKKVITSIINEFEKDRAHIAKEMIDFYNKKYAVQINRDKAEDLAKQILEDEKNNRVSNNIPQKKTDNNSLILAQLNQQKEIQIEKLKDEQKILRGLASSGIVMASFSHDLSKLSRKFKDRTYELESLFMEQVSKESYSDIADIYNPFYLLEKMRKQDLKLENWLNFSLRSTRKDKRNRKDIFFDEYFSDVNINWNSVFKPRGIDYRYTIENNIRIRAYEIDFDSIFNNLIVNSIDAFIISKLNNDRIISIDCIENKTSIDIIYSDTGPGLSEDINKPESIFEPLFTTKRDENSGDEIGTGLGMWIIKSVVEDNDGRVKLLFPDTGFKLMISFPQKYKRKS